MPQDALERPPPVPRPARGGAAETPGGEQRVSLRHLAWALPLSLAVVAGVTYATFDVEAFRPFLRDLRAGWLVAAVATVVGRVAFGAWRLRHVSGGAIGWGAGARDQVVWDFFAYVTPSAVGGGPFLVAYLARDRQLGLGEATSVVLFAMLVDQVLFALTIPALLVAAVSVDVFPPALGVAGSWALVAFFGGYLVWVAALAYGTLVRPDHLARVVGAVFRWRPLRRFRGRAHGAMADLAERARSLRAQTGAFYAKAFALSAVPWICRYLLAVFVIWSVYPAADGALAFLRAAALQIGSVAVPTPGGAGGVEGLYVLFLGPPLQPAALVAPTLLVWRVLSFYVFIAAGLALVGRHLGRGGPPRPSPPPRPLGPPA